VVLPGSLRTGFFILRLRGASVSRHVGRCVHPRSAGER